MTPKTHPTLPQAGATLTHEQAAYIAHLAGMHASAEAEATTKPEARQAIIAAARCESPRAPGVLGPLTVSILWSIQAIATIAEGKKIEELDDFALSYLLFQDPELGEDLVNAGDFQALLSHARARIKHLTIPEIKSAQDHINRQMSQLNEGKQTPAGNAAPDPVESVPSSPTETPPVTDGPSPSSSSSSLSIDSASTPPITDFPSTPPSPCSPAVPSDSATSAQA